MLYDPIQQLNDSGTTALAGNARFGYHTMPDEFLEHYAAAEEYLEAHRDGRNQIHLNAKQQLEVEPMANKAIGFLAWGGADQVITEHLQPALAELLDQVRADRKTAARYAMQESPSINMLEEDEDVRAAIVRLHSLVPRYGALRASWEICRRRAMRETADPLQLLSPLAEVGNLPDLFSDWEKARHGAAPWPWHSHVLHIKLGWLLDNGGKIWLPTCAQQDEAYHRYHPQAMTSRPRVA
ncbi:hypothetical protein SRB17_05500 [Streptomyces sp. RB17]|uniref:hypothetical protein n=1 Tax=Streptomyces sp. RB17 TaxID=2585197 RepID=UPI001295CCF6|nr:hypothetical protein [Streptomyces sp. RB17]MQY32596.1 hypothetical protein [Streptomyces sp. RB17]